MKTFTFNGITSNQYFLVNEIKRAVLPPVNVMSVKVPKKAGVMSYFSDLAERTISIRVTLLGDSTQQDFRQKVREIASWLFTTEDKDLYFNDESDRVYKARIDGKTDLDQLILIGETTLEFICSDPFAYKTWERSVLLSDNTGDTAGSEVTNEGTAEVFPLLRIFSYIDITTPVTVTNLNTGQKMTYLGGVRTLVGWTPIRIDHRNNTAYQESNGENIMKAIDIESEFFSLAPNEVTRFSVNFPPDQVALRVYLHERYL